MTPANEFLAKHFPARADDWEASAHRAILAEPEPLLPFPWLGMEVVPEPDLPQPQEIVRIAADLGHLSIQPRASTLLRFRVCADLAWCGMMLPERESYSLVVEGFSVITQAAPNPNDPDATQEAARAHIPELPPTPAPGYAFTNTDSRDWHAHLLDGDTVSIAFRNTSDHPIHIRIRGFALCFRTQL